MNIDFAHVIDRIRAPAAATVAAAAASPAPQAEQVVVNDNKVQAVPFTTLVQVVETTMTTNPTTAPVAAGNVVVQVVTTTALVTSDATPTAAADVSKPIITSGKRGLGWDPTANSATSSLFANRGVSWYFNWSPTPSSNMPSNWEFYANVWGSGGIENLANTLTGSPKLIGFNEPDSATQANLGVSDAISLYYQYLVPLKTSGKISQLGTPAVTNSWNAGEGLNWLSSFVSGCTGCYLDFAVVHWYSRSIDDFKSHVTQAHQMTGLPINVAEFAYTSWNSADQPSEAEVMAFMTEAIAWLDAQSFVIAYAWFGSMYVSESRYPSLGPANSLVNQDVSSLTSLGAAY